MYHCDTSQLTSLCTGKSLSEAVILASFNQKYDHILFIKLHVQYMKNKSSEHVVFLKIVLSAKTKAKTV